MNILVCIKQVADDSVSIGLHPSTGLPATEDVTSIVNAFDTYALEMAVRLKEECGGTVTVLSVGTDDVCNSLKNCLAVGAEHAILINDPAYVGSDGAGISKILSAAIQKLEQEQGKNFDVIFFGKESTDYASGQIGLLTAELLHRSLATCAINLSVNAGQWEVCSETEDGYCTLLVKVPAVITVSKPPYEPRYATIKSKLAARKTPITIWASTDLPTLNMSQVGVIASGEKMLGMHEPAKRVHGHIICEKTVEENVQKLMSELHDVGAL